MRSSRWLTAAASGHLTPAQVLRFFEYEYGAILTDTQLPAQCHQTLYQTGQLPDPVSRLVLDPGHPDRSDACMSVLCYASDILSVDRVEYRVSVMQPFGIGREQGISTRPEGRAGRG